MSVKDKLGGSRSSQGERAFRLWCRPDAYEERRKDRLYRKSLWAQCSSKKVSTKLRESSQEKIVHWKSSTVAGLSQLYIPRMLTHWLASYQVWSWYEHQGGSQCATAGACQSPMPRPHIPSRFFRSWSELYISWLPHPVGQKANGKNGGRGTGQKKDKSSSCCIVFLQEKKNPAFSLIVSPQFFKSLFPYTVVDVW